MVLYSWVIFCIAAPNTFRVTTFLGVKFSSRGVAIASTLKAVKIKEQYSKIF